MYSLARAIPLFAAYLWFMYLTMLSYVSAAWGVMIACLLCALMTVLGMVGDHSSPEASDG